MNDKGRFNNIIITISVMLNVVLTIMLIILLSQTGSGKQDPMADMTEEQNGYYYTENGENIFVLQTDELEAAPGNLLPEDQTTTTTTTETTTTTTTTTEAPTTTTVATIATLADAADPTQPVFFSDDTTPEDEGDWLDIWGMN